MDNYEFTNFTDLHLLAHEFQLLLFMFQVIFGPTVYEKPAEALLKILTITHLDILLKQKINLLKKHQVV